MKEKPRQETIQITAQRRTAGKRLNTRLVDIGSRGKARPQVSREGSCERWIVVARDHQGQQRSIRGHGKQCIQYGLRRTTQIQLPQQFRKTALAVNGPTLDLVYDLAQREIGQILTE